MIQRDLAPSAAPLLRPWVLLPQARVGLGRPAQEASLAHAGHRALDEALLPGMIGSWPSATLCLPLLGSAASTAVKATRMKGVRAEDPVAQWDSPGRQVGLRETGRGLTPIHSFLAWRSQDERASVRSSQSGPERGRCHHQPSTSFSSQHPRLTAVHRNPTGGKPWLSWEEGRLPGTQDCLRQE